MSKLEDFIRQHKEEFEDELQFGHLSRFEQRLVALEAPEKKRNYWPLLKGMAAACVLVVAFFLLRTQPNHTASAPVQLPSEHIEAEAFYKAQIAKQMAQLHTKKCAIDDEQKHEIETDLKEIDTYYLDLKKEMEQVGQQPQLLEAMINCYRTKNQFLQHVLQQINKNC